MSNHIIPYLQGRYRAESGPNQAYVAYYYGDDKDESLERCIDVLPAAVADKNEGARGIRINQC